MVNIGRTESAEKTGSPVLLYIGKGNSALEKQKSLACGGNVLSLYQKLRKLVYEAFDEGSRRTTRTQQMILTAMDSGRTFSMSELANLINTSNEQATRAVSQLVDMGFIVRTQNESNHRIVNICLSEDAQNYMKDIRQSIEKKLAERLFGTSKPDKKQLAQIASLIKDLDQSVTPSDN